jgi:glutamate dehydrogenase (NAD(P)+)
VGQHAARFLSQRGARLVAASDSKGAIENPAGLDVNALIAHKRSGQTVGSFPGGRRPERGGDIVGVECDIWIPAARPDTLTADNVGRLRARLVLQGANIPATAAAEEWMHAHGILSVPDFVANAGGVICAAVEYHGGTQAQAFAVIDERIRSNTLETLERARTGRVLPRQAAIQMARVRIEEAMSYRGH